MVVGHFVIMRSLNSRDARVTKCPTVTHTSLHENNNSLHIVGDRYSNTTTGTVFLSLIMSIQAFDPASYWYNLSSNNDLSLCKLLLLEECIYISILLNYGLIRQKVVNGDITMEIFYDKWISFIAEYELVNVEINKSKVDVLVQNKFVRRNVYFFRIGNKNYFHFSKHPNNTAHFQ